MCSNFTGSPFREKRKAHPVMSLMACCSQKQGTAQDSSLKTQTQIFSFPDNTGTHAFKNGLNRGRILSLGNTLQWRYFLGLRDRTWQGLKGAGNLCHINGLHGGQWWHEQQHYLVQLSLLASLTSQQCQRRGGNTEEETAAAVRLGTPNLKHSRGCSIYARSLPQLKQPQLLMCHVLKTPDHLGGPLWDFVCQCLSCTVKNQSIWLSLPSCEKVF